MHNTPLSNLEKAGLGAHGLDIGKPSQLSDAFRQGVSWALEHADIDCCGEELVSHHSYGCTKPRALNA